MPKCLGGCGRHLTDPASIARGYGKTCAERHGIPVSPPERKPARTLPPRTSPTTTQQPHPGQTELPIAVQLAF
ncbi:DUF6011 domain-containing protein [Streptomyces sp. NPDC002920]